MQSDLQQRKTYKCPRPSDMLYCRLSRRSRINVQRAVLIVAVASLSLLLYFALVHHGFSPVYKEKEDTYHPVNGRFIHDRHISPEKSAAFNKLVSRDVLVAQLKDQKRPASLHNYGSKNTSIYRKGDGPPSFQEPCHCNSTKQQLRQSTRYPFSEFKDYNNMDSFSIVILTYNRSDLLLRLLNHYSAMSHLERIVVVCNAIDEMTSPERDWTQLGPHPVPVEFKVQAENRLRNRLQFFPEIKSSAIFLVDDDLLISARDIQFAFRVWKEFSHLIVGFYPRKHVRSSVTGLYSYGSDELDSLTELGSFSYSMTLTGAAFIHKRYIKMFNDHNVVPQDVHKLIDTINNCEDIAMNVMVGRYLLGELGRPQCSGLFVKPVQLQNLERETNSGYKGLWRDPSHLAERSYCLNHLAAIYNDGPLPLFYSDLAMVQMQTAMAKCAQLS